MTKSSVFFTLLSFFFPPNSVKITVAPPIRFPRKFTRNFNSMVFRSFAINNTRIVTWTASVINECDNVASNNALVFSPVLAYVYETSFRLLFRRPIWSFYSLFFLSFLLLFSTSLPSLAVSFRTRTEQTRTRIRAFRSHCPQIPDTKE